MVKLKRNEKIKLNFNNNLKQQSLETKTCVRPRYKQTVKIMWKSDIDAVGKL